MIRVYVGLGANLGDRLASLRAAMQELADTEGVELRARSSVWETRPLGDASTVNFLNAVVELRTSLHPRELLARLLEIEQRHGRVRRERWGDRTLDLDLLCAHGAEGEITLAEPGLELPHPGLGARDFVLRPLLELAPDLVVGGRACAELLDGLEPSARTVIGRVELL